MEKVDFWGPAPRCINKNERPGEFCPAVTPPLLLSERYGQTVDLISIVIVTHSVIDNQKSMFVLALSEWMECFQICKTTHASLQTLCMKGVPEIETTQRKHEISCMSEERSVVLLSSTNSPADRIEWTCKCENFTKSIPKRALPVDTCSLPAAPKEAGGSSVWPLKVSGKPLRRTNRVG